MKPEIIVLIGGPGCGKGSVAAALCAARNFNYIETGALFRALPVDSIIARTIAGGNLAPDDELFALLESKTDRTADILFDGFPRTVPQAEWMIKKYSTDFEIRVIHIDVPTDIMRDRIRKRKIEGSTRADDTDDTVIARRLQNFSAQTAPAIEWLRVCPAVDFINIDGIPCVTDVIADVLQQLST